MNFEKKSIGVLSHELSITSSQTYSIKGLAPILSWYHVDGTQFRRIISLSWSYSLFPRKSRPEYVLHAGSIILVHENVI